MRRWCRDRRVKEIPGVENKNIPLLFLPFTDHCGSPDQAANRLVPSGRTGLDITIDVVAIDNEVIDSCIEYFPIVSNGSNDPNVKIFTDDGIKFIEEKHNIYDLIIIDSRYPIGPAEGLFETKFYGNVHKALKSNGIMVTQSESPFQDKNLWSKIYKDISSVFPMAFSYLAYIPTYPSGMWSFTIGSKSVHPVDDMRYEVATDLSFKTLYYNPSVHKSAFSLPNFLHSELESIS